MARDVEPIVGTPREQQLLETFVALADTLGDDGPLDRMAVLADRAVDLCDVSAVGILLVDADGVVTVAAASSERSRLLAEFAVDVADGPDIACVRTGAPVTCDDVRIDAQRWPAFAAGATEAGFRAVHALPMRLRDDVVGGLVLLHAEPHALAPENQRLAQALADAAAIGVVQQRTLRRARTTARYLQEALDSRVVVEQAKGVLAHYAMVDPQAAFDLLHRHARAHDLLLDDLARGVVDGSVAASTVIHTHP